MPLNPNRPARSEQNKTSYPRLVFGGVFLPWQDPSFSLQAVSKKLLSAQRGSLTLIGGPHPNYPIKEGVYADLFAKLSENPAVEIKPMLPYDSFIDELLTADAAVDLMKWNLERQLAVTIRTTTYLWAGVPVIYNDFADLSKLIQKYDAGWSIPTEDEEALSNVLDEILTKPEIVAAKSQNASRLAAEVFAWDRAVTPLLDFFGKGGVKHSRETDVVIDFPDNAELTISNGAPLEQYFLCRLPGLSRIEFRLATHARKISAPLKFELFEVVGADTDSTKLKSSTKVLIHSAEVLSKDIVNNEWSVFDVPPVPNSAGKTFLFRLSSTAQHKDESVSPWLLKGSPYPLLRLYHGSKQIEHASLCFRTTCSRSSINYE